MVGSNTSPANIAKRHTVQEQPLDSQTRGIGETLVFALAGIADDIPPWGALPVRRDQMLRAFYPTEPTLASAVFTIAGRNAAFNWELDGPERSVAAVQRLLVEGSDLGAGWTSLMIKIGTDLFTQDNGAFLEVIRQSDSESSPVVGIAHLDSGRCIRTGRWDEPVIYTDRKNRFHLLKWYQVIDLAEMPSPVETMNGMQLCAVSRVLRAAQLLRDVGIYQREKIGGKTATSIYLVGGVQRQAVEEAMQSHSQHQIEQGFTRYIKPAVLASLDPTKPVSVEEIAISSLPDGFDLDQVMTWYITQLAMGFGADYQDFAPLPGGALGSSQQSLILHQKSRGRGPALFMKMIEHIFNYQGIMPRNVTFRYMEQDVAADTEEAELENERAKTDKIYLETNVWTPESVRQQQLDRGQITEEVFDSLQEDPDITPEVTVTDEVPAENKGRKVEGVPDFQEDDRLAAETVMQREMAAGLTKMFRLLKKDILPAKALSLRRGRKQGPGEALENPEFWNDFRVEMVSRMLPLARKNALTAAQFNVDLGLAIDMEAVNAQVLEFSSTYTNTWWNQLEGVTRANFRKALVAWQDSGLGNQGLPDLVNAIEPMFGKARAERIAVTEVTRIFDEGNQLAYKAAGIETEEWQTARDDKVDSICAALDGEQFPIDTGPRPVTDTHIRCRCARLPVAADGVALGR